MVINIIEAIKLIKTIDSIPRKSDGSYRINILPIEAKLLFVRSPFHYTGWLRVNGVQEIEFIHNLLTKTIAKILHQNIVDVGPEFTTPIDRMVSHADDNN